jgi:hypothetical protein
VEALSSERDQLYKTVQEIAVEVNTVKAAWMADRAKLQSFEQGQQIQGMQQMQVQAVQQHQHQQQVRRGTLACLHQMVPGRENTEAIIGLRRSPPAADGANGYAAGDDTPARGFAAAAGASARCMAN